MASLSGGLRKSRLPYVRLLVLRSHLRCPSLQCATMRVITAIATTGNALSELVRSQSLRTSMRTLSWVTILKWMILRASPMRTQSPIQTQNRMGTDMATRTVTMVTADSLITSPPQRWSQCQTLRQSLSLIILVTVMISQRRTGGAVTIPDVTTDGTHLLITLPSDSRTKNRKKEDF